MDRKCGGTLTFTDNNGARNGQQAGQVVINASNSRSTENSNALNKKNVVRMFGYPGKGGAIAFSYQIYIPRVAASPKLARAFAREAILARHGQTWSAEKFGKMPTLWANYDALPKDDPNFAFVRRVREHQHGAAHAPGRGAGLHLRHALRGDPPRHDPPTLAVFMLLQRHYVRGVSEGAFAGF